MGSLAGGRRSLAALRSGRYGWCAPTSGSDTQKREKNEQSCCTCSMREGAQQGAPGLRRPGHVAAPARRPALPAGCSAPAKAPGPAATGRRGGCPSARCKEATGTDSDSAQKGEGGGGACCSSLPPRTAARRSAAEHSRHAGCGARLCPSASSMRAQHARQGGVPSHLLDQPVGVALDAPPRAEVGAHAPRPPALEEPVGGVYHILQPEELLPLTRLGGHDRCGAQGWGGGDAEVGSEGMEAGSHLSEWAVVWPGPSPAGAAGVSGQQAARRRGAA